MTLRPNLLQTTIAAGLTVAAIVPMTHGGHPSVLGATPVSACQSVTPQSVNAYAATIDRALRYANADARANGENGSYAVAARNSRDLLDRAKKRVEASEFGTTAAAGGHSLSLHRPAGGGQAHAGRARAEGHLLGPRKL